MKKNASEAQIRDFVEAKMLQDVGYERDPNPDDGIIKAISEACSISNARPVSLLWALELSGVDMDALIHVRSGGGTPQVDFDSSLIQMAT